MDDDDEMPSSFCPLANWRKHGAHSAPKPPLYKTERPDGRVDEGHLTKNRKDQGLVGETEKRQRGARTGTRGVCQSTAKGTPEPRRFRPATNLPICALGFLFAVDWCRAHFCESNFKPTGWPRRRRELSLRVLNGACGAHGAACWGLGTRRWATRSVLTQNTVPRGCQHFPVSDNESQKNKATS